MKHLRSVKSRRERFERIRTHIYSATIHDPIRRETVSLEWGSGDVGGIRFYLEPGEVLEDSTRTGTLDRI